MNVSKVIISGILIGLAAGGFYYLSVDKGSAEMPSYSVLTPLSDDPVITKDIEPEPVAPISIISEKIGFEPLKASVSKRLGNYSLYIKDLDSGKTYEIDPERNIYAASLYKIPVAVVTVKEIEKGNLAFDTEITYTSADSAGGSGVLNTEEIGTKYTIARLLSTLLKESDNVSQNMLLRTVSKTSIQEVFNAYLEGTKSQFSKDNISNAKEISLFFENFYESDYISGKNREYLIDLMSSTSYDDRIADHLLPGVKFAHKIGSWGETGSWHDCGIVLGDDIELVACLMSENTTYEDFMLTGKEVAGFINTLVE